MNIAITGSGGFLGSNIVKVLSLKHSINLINRVNLSNFDKDYIFTNTDCVIHLAGIAHDIKQNTKSHEYYLINTELTTKVFDSFLSSSAKIFIFISSVKAVADKLESTLTEDYLPHPITDYGKSKLLAEENILSKKSNDSKKIYILRPCMIHGPKNKGNLNLLYNFIKKGFPWPLGAYKNKRSFCSIDNIIFIVNELIQNDNIPSGIYNIADDDPISTNELIEIISNAIGIKTFIFYIPKYLIFSIAKFGDYFGLTFNTERLNKLTETYIVSNSKIKKHIKKNLPRTSREGLLYTFQSFIK
jgi:nucleoside-diphosphate-sugar epimerase